MAKGGRQCARRLTPELWLKVRRRIESGETAVSLAAQFGIPVPSIYKRSMRERWKTPAKLAKAERDAKEGRINKSRYDDTSAARAAGSAGPLMERDNASNLHLQPTCNSDPPARMAPGDVQDLVGDRLEQVIIASLPEVGTTGSPRELATLVDVFRKMRGLDGRNSAPAGPRLHAPRSIGRPAPLAPPAAPQEFEIE